MLLFCGLAKATLESFSSFLLFQKLIYLMILITPITMVMPGDNSYSPISMFFWKTGKHKFLNSAVTHQYAILISVIFIYIFRFLTTFSFYFYFFNASYLHCFCVFFCARQFVTYRLAFYVTVLLWDIGSSLFDKWGIHTFLPNFILND